MCNIQSYRNESTMKKNWIGNCKSWREKNHTTLSVLNEEIETGRRIGEKNIRIKKRD